MTHVPLLDRLEPGVRVTSEAELTKNHLATKVPCCMRTITLQQPDDEDQARPAVRCRRRVFYLVTLVQEEPGGYDDEPPPHVAVFTVQYLDLAVARHRASRYETKKTTADRPQTSALLPIDPQDTIPLL